MKIPLIALPHRVTVIPFKGSGAYGPIYDETNKKSNVPCLIERRIQKIQSANGDDVVQQADAVFHPDWTIHQGDKIIWDQAGAEYTIQSVIPIDAMGPHSIEAVLT
jgi:hypothetical protein